MKKLIIQIVFAAITSAYCIAQNGPQLRRIEGQGNDGLVLDFVAGMHDSILASVTNKYNYPLYDNNKGPVYVDIYDPSITPPGDYQIVFNGISDTAKWKVVYLPTNTTVLGDSIIGKNYLQDIPQWGMKIRTRPTDDPGGTLYTYTGYLEATMTFADNTKQWLTGLADQDGISYANWIRSGSYMDLSNSQYNDYTSNIDQYEEYETLIGGTWAPYRLCAYTITGVGAAYTGGPAWSNAISMTINKLSNIASVDIVMTSDKSKWTRCPVLELEENTPLAIGGASKLNMRASLSVDKNGNSAALGSGSSTNPADPNYIAENGMGWFPGYAINLETGERLNMAFGEDSWLTSENGNDMRWNPTSTILSVTSNPLFGGKHYIYVFGHNGDAVYSAADLYMPGKLRDVPRYDGGKAIHDLLTTAATVSSPASDTYKREVYGDAMWASIPLLKPGHSLLETDVSIRLRVSKKYQKYGIGTPVAAGNSLVPFASYFVESGNVTYNAINYPVKTVFIADNVGTPYNISSGSNPPVPSVLTTVNAANPMYIFNTGSLVGVKENKKENSQIIIYPNPATTNITVNFKSSAKNYSIKMYDATGRMVKNIERVSSVTTIVNIEDLDNGIYLLNVFDGKNSSVERFIKQ